MNIKCDLCSRIFDTDTPTSFFYKADNQWAFYCEQHKFELEAYEERRGQVVLSREDALKELDLLCKILPNDAKEVSIVDYNDGSLCLVFKETKRKVIEISKE
jgi:hypothetical protein